MSSRPLTVSMFVGGSAGSGIDYVALASATIPAGAAEVTLPIVPIDDSLLENNETVTLTLRAGSGYVVGSPSIATVTIVSDDVAADLTISALTVPAKGTPGATITVTDTTRNQGTGASTGSRTSFYLSRDVFLDGADTPIGVRAVEPLAVGSVSTGTVALTLPEDLATGSYFLFAKADGPGEVIEVNESNNIRASAIAVGADLLVTNFSVPASAAAGGTITVSDTTANQGSAPAAASVTSFYLSANVTFDASDTLLQSRSAPALAANGTSIAGTTLTLPANLATGNYYLIAQADGSGVVAELNEINNGRAAAIKVGPDLVVSSLITPTRASAGGTIAVTDTTSNNGSSPAAASTTAFYLSLNITLEPGDIRLETVRTIPALAANHSSTATTTLALPAPLATGVWYVLAAADDGARAWPRPRKPTTAASRACWSDRTSFSGRHLAERRDGRGDNHRDVDGAKRRRWIGGGLDDPVLPVDQHEPRRVGRAARRATGGARPRRGRLVLVVHVARAAAGHGGNVLSVDGRGRRPGGCRDERGEQPGGEAAAVNEALRG